ncbi:sulfide/dihydroorotate dehydrogenase-like FAD/NAD-binding protein [Balneolaceae bacterium ANBcel3]|nr:sulfide/dihydroorotate dehydrogenase-like FAD/NAD-binding protein [Balneolaceae bacterium ANBcel3]
MYPIIDKQILAPSIAKLIVEAPLIAKKRKAGNFVIVRASEYGERIPFTIVDSDPENGTITLIIQAIGKSSDDITRLEPGDHFLDVVGPLGEATPIKNSGTVVCIGGGVGTAVIYPIAKALKNAGNTVISIIGARNKEMIILEEEMDKVSDELIITTDDGSAGVKGFVTNALQEIMGKNPDLATVYAIGPLPMMKAVSGVTKPAGIKTYVSLNPIMMDGTGMCGACRVTVGGEMKFACVDGPEFDAHQIEFDELIARNNSYRDVEQHAYHQCRQESQT